MRSALHLVVALSTGFQPCLASRRDPRELIATVRKSAVVRPGVESSL